MAKIKTPPTVSGVLQAIMPMRNPDGAALAVGAVSASSANMIGSEAVVLFSTTDIHIRFASAGPANTQDYIVPAFAERVVHCRQEDYLHAVTCGWAAPGTLYWWPCESIT